MTRIQFLLLLLSSLPFIGAILVIILKKYPQISEKITMILSLFFLINSFGLLANFLTNHHGVTDLIKMSRNIAIGLMIDPISLIFLILIALIWIALNFYSNRFFILTNDNRLTQFQTFSSLNIGFIILLILSKNLVSMFLFYQALIFCIYFFNSYFMSKTDVKASYNFTFIALLGSIAFLIAIILTYKLTGQTEFGASGIINNNLSNSAYILLLSLYLIGIATIAFAPFYLLYGNLYYLNPPVIITVFIVSYGFAALFMILKIIAYIFGFVIFISYNQEFHYSIILSLILISNLLACGIFTIIGHNLKKILLYLFFNQLIMTILSFFIFQKTVYQISISIISFILSQILIFMCVGNFNIFISKSKDKTLNGALYKLKITSILFIFAMLSIIGFAPSIGLIEKYLLIKQIIKSQSLLFGLTFIANIILNIICICKIIYPIIRASETANPEALAEAAKIERDWHLILPIILIALIMFLGFLFSVPIINFSKRVF